MCLNILIFCDTDVQCDPRTFQCDNQNCVLPNLICNEVDDCEDGSDEKGCGKS